MLAISSLGLRPYVNEFYEKVSNPKESTIQTSSCIPKLHKISYVLRHRLKAVITERIYLMYNSKSEKAGMICKIKNQTETSTPFNYLGPVLH